MRRECLAGVFRRAKWREPGRELAILRAAMRGLAVTLAIGAALAFAACGGDDNDNASNDTATTQTTATQGTGKTGKRGKETAKAGKSKKGTGASPTSGGSKTETATTQTQSETPSVPQTPKGPYAVAKTVCQNIVPTVVQRQLKQGKTTKKKVARQYSTGWPPNQRKRAYRGCLAGLNKKF